MLLPRPPMAAPAVAEYRGLWLFLPDCDSLSSCCVVRPRVRKKIEHPNAFCNIV
jgi:hypothetical protein